MLAKILRMALACIALICTLHSIAQYSNYHEPYQDTRGSSGINVYIGGNTFLGDLGGTKGRGAPFVKDFNSKTIRPYVGASYTRFPFSWLAVKGGLHYTWVTGADSLIKIKQGNAAGRFVRNLNFKSALAEVSAEVELYPIQTLWQYEEAGWRPYIGSGIGVFHFNPKAMLNGKWYKLKPLHIEGQGFAEYPERKDYKLTQLYIPLTLGLKHRISNSYFVSLSATFRKTFTDYIDDVSTSYIDPNLYDKYLAPKDAILAKQLYYRGTTPFETVTPDPYRGYPSKDSYTSLFFSITYLLNNRDGYRFIGY